MALSKPIYNLLGIYFQNLHYNPVRTRAITSCLSHVFGNLTSQYLSGKRPFNEECLMAFGLFGLFLGGPINYLLEWGLDAVFTSDSTLFYLKQFLAERLLFTPIYTAFSIYLIYRLQGETHNNSFGKLLFRFGIILQANWKWLTLIQFINYKMIPPMFRDLVAFTVSFFWCIYLSRKLCSSKKKGPQK